MGDKEIFFKCDNPQNQDFNLDCKNTCYGEILIMMLKLDEVLERKPFSML